MRLSEKLFHKHSTSSCFVVEGAQLAENQLLEWGYEEPRARRVADAICLYLNVSVNSVNSGDEFYLLREASGLDIAGIGATKVHTRNRREVLRQSPRIKEWISEVTDRLKPVFHLLTQLTLSPAKMTPENIQCMKDAGWTGEAVHSVILVASLFAFMNRYVDGLDIRYERRFAQVIAKRFKAKGYA